MKTKLLIAIALLLSGCAMFQYWDKPGTTSDDHQRDGAECKYQAALASAGVADGFMRGFRQVELTDMCLRQKGYTLHQR